MALILSVFYVSPETARAQTTSAASIGAGGTGRASVEASAIHDLNPAMLVHLRDRDLHSAVVSDGWSVGMTDNSQDILMPAGLSWRTQKTTSDRSADLVATDLRLSLGGFFSKTVSLGITGKQQRWTQGEAEWNQINGDIGLGWIATKKIGLGLVMSDIYGEREELPRTLRTPTRTALGLNYLYREFIRLRADVVSAARNDFKRPALLMGYESSLNEYFLVRFGYGIDHEKDREYASAGIGLSLPRFRLNYGLEAKVHGEGESLHSVDLGIPF